MLSGKPLRDLCEACAVSCGNAPNCSNTSVRAPPHCAGRSRLVTGYVGWKVGAAKKSIGFWSMPAAVAETVAVTVAVPVALAVAVAVAVAAATMVTVEHL